MLRRFRRKREWHILNAIDGKSTSLDEKQKVYTNWREFAQRVCAPIVETHEEASDEVLALLRGESAYYLVTALYMADRALARCEANIELE